MSSVLVDYNERGLDRGFHSYQSQCRIGSSCYLVIGIGIDKVLVVSVPERLAANKCLTLALEFLPQADWQHVFPLCPFQAEDRGICRSVFYKHYHILILVLSFITLIRHKHLMLHKSSTCKALLLVKDIIFENTNKSYIYCIKFVLRSNNGKRNT